jgi:hypothetical protein
MLTKLENTKSAVAIFYIKINERLRNLPKTNAMFAHIK